MTANVGGPRLHQSPKNKPFSVAVVGAGQWGQNLIRNLVAHPRSKLVGVCDLSAQAKERAAVDSPEVLLFTDIEEMLRQVRPDAVVIATPPGLHFAHAKFCLEGGVHVLVEKPMATTAGEARELVRLADMHKLVLMTGHTFLYNNIVREVKERIHSGDLGDIYYLYSQRLNLGQVRDDVDVLWNLAPHDVSIANYLFEARPHRASARGLSYIQPERGLADVCFGQLDYPDGRSALMHLSWLDPMKIRRTVIVGSEKMLVYDDVDTDGHIKVFDKRVEREYRAPVKGFADFKSRLRAGDVVIPNVQLIEPLSVEIGHFLDCVANGQSPLTDGEHGLEVVCILEALSQSMREEGRPVEVEYLG